jgi:hypothetical protein
VKPAAIQQVRPTEAEDIQGEDRGPLPRLLKSSPPWLVSSVVHTLVVIILALIVVAHNADDEVILDVSYAPHLGDPFADDERNMGEETDPEDSIITPTELPPVENPFAAPLPLPPDMGNLASSAAMSDVVGLALKGRDAGMKKALLIKFGGDETTEAAVDLGLKWLVKQQRPDGSWSLRGPYSNPAAVEDRTAATGLAMIALQGANHTHRWGTYREHVEKGLKYLVKVQKDDGDLFNGDREHNWLYSHAIGTIALCELYAMTGDTALEEPAQKAVNFCVDAQHSEGGWRYAPRRDHDTSVTGWMVMALQSAKMGGLKVPPEALYRVEEFLNQVGSEGGSRYAYQPGNSSDRVMTAEGLLCRQYLGWSQSEEPLLRGADLLVSRENLPSWNERNVYYWYYASQVLHHLEGSRWDTWNAAMKPVLTQHQTKSGLEAGSWHPEPDADHADQWGAWGGRLYTTCLSIFVLEVYYRHMPLYSDMSRQIGSR